MSGARREPFRPRSGGPLPLAMRAVAFPGARPAAATPITSPTGPTAVRRHSITCCSCVGATTGWCMKADTQWPSRRAAQSSSAPMGGVSMRRPRWRGEARPTTTTRQAPSRCGAGTVRRLASSTRWMCCAVVNPRRDLISNTDQVPRSVSLQAEMAIRTIRTRCQAPRELAYGGAERTLVCSALANDSSQ